VSEAEGLRTLWQKSCDLSLVSHSHAASDADASLHSSPNAHLSRRCDSDGRSGLVVRGCGVSDNAGSLSLTQLNSILVALPHSPYDICEFEYGVCRVVVNETNNGSMG